jgi:hypothetical protein
MGAVRSRALALVFVAAVVASCSTAGSPWPSLDFSDQGLPFDPGLIIDSTASLTDPYALPQVSDVQSFLAKTPYGTASFLATYSSNGVSAAAAISNASFTYQLNPLLFLVRAEMDQGLVAATAYPSPASRVEFVFGCGCSQSGATTSCDPLLAGFDKQVDCLAREVRADLDAACGITHLTSGGWGLGKTSTTIDGVDVAPENEGTAVLYQYTPVVLEQRAGGNWFFWNLYQLFAIATGYPGSFAEAWVGDSCCGDSACPFPNGLCAVNVPNGMCTAPCSTTEPCPTDPDRTAICTSLSGQGFCLLDCSADPCRAGYTCQPVSVVGGGQGTACLPAN